MKRVLVIAVHPDDESLGAGGSLLRHIDYGDEVHWLILTRPQIEQGFADSYAEKQKGVVDSVASAYGFTSTHQCEFPAAGLGLVAEGKLVGEISDHVKRIKPHVVYLPFLYDVHGDHKVAFNAAFSSLKPFRHPYIEEVLMVETISETDQAVSLSGQGFTPNYYVDISPYIERKLEILSLFSTEVLAAPFPRSIEAVRGLAQFRGAAIAAHYAEAFCMLRTCLR